MIPRNLKHVGPYADKVNNRAPASEPVPDNCKGALKDPNGGLFLPWCAPVTADRLKELQRELFEAVDEVARLEHWPDDDYDLVIGAIERQPPSTLLPDLDHFRTRLRAARAGEQARQAASRRAWRFDR
ncbi:hypothetical protein [Burkholderia sp. Bp8991]|uniref:hypothetical protein n=1 Tax=Burkholderia sp. Bp8991 TaxID=2184553 RepID=UPI000F5B329E|nr:hypothetical protein [Burkholderia sp. Bp8991]